MVKKLLLTPVILVLCSCANNQLKTSEAQIQTPFIAQPTPPPKAALVALELPPTSSKPQPQSVVKLENKPLFGEKLQRPEKKETKAEGWLPKIAGYIKRGIASWYGPGFHGRKTANGEIYNMYAMTAAHRTLPIPSYAEVTNLKTNKSVIVRINDRGPYVGNRVLDLSYAAAKKLGIQGVGKVEVKAITPLQALPQIQQTAENQNKDVFFQLGSFGSQSKAMMLQDKVAANNLPQPTILTSKHKRKTQYKVQIGPLKSKESAVTLAYKLSKIGIKDPEIVTASR